MLYFATGYGGGTSHSQFPIRIIHNSSKRYLWVVIVTEIGRIIHNRQIHHLHRRCQMEMIRVKNVIYFYPRNASLP